MNIFRGLNERQMGAIRHVRAQRMVAAGTPLFLEGDPAVNLYIVISGRIRVTRKTAAGLVELASLGCNDVLGEMGIILASGFRTATATAVEDTHVLEVPVHLIDLFHRFQDIEAATIILQNLVCVLAQRLREANKMCPDLFKGAEPFSPFYQRDLKEALATIESSLPKGLLSILSGNKKLKPGDILCEQGADPDGFYYIHKGELEVVQRSGSLERDLGRIHGPTIAGEIGFFSGEPRGATIRAISDVEYTRFAGADFARLKKKDPEQALAVLSAAAQFAVHLILKREGEGRS